MTQTLSPLDNVFFQMESNDTPMHVAGLQLFLLPDHADDGFIQALVASWRSPTHLKAPWNLKLKQGRLGRRWEQDHDVDLDYHIRHIALPRPGGERELGAMISRLHGHRLRRHRPLWECYVIEGLADQRFAVYTKMHHSMADGVRAMGLMTQSLSKLEDDRLPAPWAAGDEAANDSVRVGADTPSKPAALADSVRNASAALSGVSKAGGRVLRQMLGGRGHLTLPLTAPPSALNSRITGQRRYATQQVDMARLKAAGRATDATVNDVVLTLCSSALRRFLKRTNQLPPRSLIAGVPVSLRAAGDTSSSNAVSIMLASLGTDFADPLERLESIRHTTEAGKAHLKAIPRAGQQIYNSLLMTPFVLQTVSGVGAIRHPYFNLTVSSVPGPSRPLYLNGAQMEAMFPVSIPTHGQALNITCTSYNGWLNVGFCGCRDAMPHLQRIAVYFGEALTELEAALAQRSVRSGQPETLPQAANA